MSTLRAILGQELCRLVMKSALANKTADVIMKLTESIK